MITRVSFCLLSLVAVILAFFLLWPSDSPSSVSGRVEKIPDSIISLTSGFVIVVDKQQQKIYAFKKNGSFTKVFEAPCSTGKNSGGKQIEGDAKTPVGIFFVTRIARNPGPPETYGSLALPLDFPNLTDQSAGRQGTNIWIHGTINPLLPFQSNGCVVLRDQDVLDLEKFIHLQKTPVIISESVNWVFENEQMQPHKDELKSVLQAWNQAFRKGDLEALDALYLPGTEIKNKKRIDLVRRINQIQKAAPHFTLEPRDVSILQHNDSAVILFDQITAIQPDNSFSGFYNRLTLKKVNSRWHIIDDVPQVQIAKIDSPSTEVVRPPVQEKPDFTVEREKIGQLITRWATSWEKGNMNTYRDCYATSFRSRGMNLNAWVQNKTDIRNRSKNIRIRVDRVRIKAEANSAEATFTQHYSSSLLKNSVNKKLELRKINGEWKIYREGIQ